MSNKNIIRLTESKLKNIIMETVKDALKEDSEREWYEYVQQEKQKYQTLLNFLKSKGIQSAKLTETPGGAPTIAIDTDEYHSANVGVLADKFVRGKRGYISTRSFPATTYLIIND